MIKRQFGYIQGLTSTLLLSSRPHPPLGSGALQIIHTRGNHWILASSIGCKNEVLVFGFLYCDIDGPTKCMIMEIFGAGVDIRMGQSPKQEGVKDCGIFDSICTSLLYRQFKQNFLRSLDSLLREHAPGSFSFYIGCNPTNSYALNLFPHDCVCCYSKCR